MIFIFHHIMRGSVFSDPGRGGKNSVLKFLKLISFLIHKTTPETTWGSNVSPMLRKMEELVPPPLARTQGSPNQIQWYQFNHTCLGNKLKMAFLVSMVLNLGCALPYKGGVCDWWCATSNILQIFCYWCCYLHKLYSLSSVCGGGMHFITPFLC